MKIRTFIAVPISPVNRSALAEIIEKLKAVDPGREFRWVSPDKIHLTLKFLGDVEQERVRSLSEALDHVGKNQLSFTMQIIGLGCFPGVQRARVIWAGLKGDVKSPLFSLQTEVERELELLGFPPENRNYHPHLTLARIKNPVEHRRIECLLDRGEAFEAVEPVHDIVLMQSRIGRGGSMYTELHRSPLSCSR